jgi:uncharacterized glyoxalase superfamily protein PhnB
MKPTPPGWPRITSGLHYREAARMIDWLCAAYGFTVALKVEGEGGRIEHSELDYGDGRIMVGEEERPGEVRFGSRRVSPLTAGANTQCLMVYVDDCDAHCARAREHGARIVAEPAVHDYGEDYWAERTYGALDPEGHIWWFSQRLRSAA